MAANQSVVTFQKPLKHISLNDWNQRISQLRNVSETKRLDSFTERQSSRHLRNESTVESFWTTYYNNERISERITEVDRWRQSIEIAKSRIEKEISMLRAEKSGTEKCLESMTTPIIVVSECLSQRDVRLTNELTLDDCDTELHRELCIVESNQRLLRDQCQSAWGKLNELNQVRFKLDLDIGDKLEATQIDDEQLRLDKSCSNITYKTDALRIPRNSCTYRGWLENCKELKLLSEKELTESYAIRESLFVAREKAKNVLHAQQEKTEYTIRQRIFETQKNRNELEFQKLKTQEELHKVFIEINDLHKTLEVKDNALKLAESRLENRTNRSGMELVLDSVFDGLSDEVVNLKEIRLMLKDKIVKAKGTANLLEAQINNIDRDLQNKQHSLSVDVRGLDMRMRLKENAWDTSSNRAFEFTNMENQVSRY
ncbi:unnamed protein product [Diamesa hyperborea]